MEKKDWTVMAVIVFVFGLFYFVPYNSSWFNDSLVGGANLLNEYAKKHVLTCLIPALLIAGAISVFIKKDNVMKYLGSDAKKQVSYGIASVSGAILAVCSCTILPLFAGIRKRGAGLGPAVTFLFAGPAINIAAMFLTMSVLGAKIGVGRIIFSIVLSILAGITMSFIFREKAEKGKFSAAEPEQSWISNKTLALFFALMVGLLVTNGLQINEVAKYSVMALLALCVIGLVAWKFKHGLARRWLEESWSFSKIILPLLFMGVFIAGFVMPLLPQSIIERLAGSNNLTGNLIASVFGAFMYFSTLTEIPIIQALMAKGMAEGPALALLLAGPSLSLPNMLVIRKVLGTTKTITYILIVIAYSTIAGLFFGSL